MMRRLSLALVALSLALSALAQRVDMRELFLSIPTSVSPLMTEERKIDLLDRYDTEKAGKSYTSPLTRQLFYDAEGMILNITEDYLHLRLDGDSSMQLKVLPKGWRGYVVSVVLTSEVVPKQSVLLFYDQKWQPLNTEDYFRVPSLEAFLTDAKLLTLNEVKHLFGEVGALTYSYNWSESDRVMTARLTTFDGPLYKRLYPKAIQWLRPEGVTYQWKRGQLRNR